jgi:flagellar hook-associated protein 3 FlgL
MITATSTAYQAVLNNLLAAENRETTAQQQVSSQKIATNLDGYGNQAATLVATQSVKTRVDGLVSQLNQTSTALTFQQTALSQVSTVASSLQQALQNALATGSATGLMSSIQTLFSQASDALNTQYNGNYIFSGGQTSTQPFTATSLSDLTSQTDVSSFFQNGTLVPTSRTDDDSTTQTGFLASDVGQSLMASFQSIEAFQQGSSGNMDGTLTSAQQTFLTNAVTQLDSVVSDATNTTAEGGNIQSAVKTALTTQTDRQTTLASVLDGITQANLADAASNLTQAQTAVQASAQVFTTLKGMSLLNYLSSTTTA